MKKVSLEVIFWVTFLMLSRSGVLVREGSQEIRDGFHFPVGYTGRNIEECFSSAGPEPESLTYFPSPTN